MIKIRNDQLQNARIALSALDGIDRTVKDGDRERVVLQQFSFTSGVLMLKVKLMNRLDLLLQLRAEARNTLLRQVSGGLSSLDQQKQPEQFSEFSRLVEDLEKQVNEINLKPLVEADFDLAKNNIPASVLGALGPLLLIEDDKGTSST